MHTASADLAQPPFALPPWVVGKIVPVAPDYEGDILHLGPKAEIERPALPRPRVLYVVGGDVTARVGRTHHMLALDGTLLIEAEKSLVLVNHGDAPAKVFLLTLPEPRVQWRLIPPDAFASR